MVAKYVEGDHGTIIRRHIKDEKGTKLDITGAISVTLRWLQNGLPIERAMTITDPINGIVEYVIQANDFIAQEGLQFELEYTDSANNRYTTPALDGPYEIRKPLGATTTALARAGGRARS